MTKKSIAILAVTTLVVIGAAWIIIQQRLPETEIARTSLFPELVNRVNEISRIEIRSKNQNTVLVKRGDGWVIENRSHFPALFEKVKGTVLALAELEILEGKTKNKELYPRLGVEEVDTQEAASTLISLLAQEGQTLASLIVGKERISKSGRGIATLYVRKAGEDQALLVKGSLHLSAQPADWLNKKLLNINPERIREITIQHPEQNPTRIYREDRETKDYTLEKIPEGSKLRSQVMLNSLATALDDLRFDDMLSRTDFTFPPQHTVTTLRAFDGLVATVTTATIDDKTHARFEFSHDAAQAPQTQPATNPVENTASKVAESTQGNTSAVEKAQAEQSKSKPASEEKPQESVEPEATRLNEQIRHWVYVLPGLKATLLTKTMGDLVMPKMEDLVMPKEEKQAEEKKN